MVALDGDDEVVDAGEAAVAVTLDVRRTTIAVVAARPPGGRKRQRSSPEWAETA